LRSENLNNIQFRHTDWIDCIEFLLEKDCKITIRIFTNVKSRENGLPSRGKHWQTFDRDFFQSDKQLLDVVRNLAHYAVKHEIDECLYLGKKRVYDPHLEEP